MNPEIMAFWAYANFPYIIGGTVTRVSDEGRVETAEFGSGVLFRPVFILPAAKGASIRAGLRELSSAHRKGLQEFENRHLDAVIGYLRAQGVGVDLEKHRRG